VWHPQVHAKHVMPPAHIVTVSSKDDPHHAYHVMADADIRSAPVWDESKGKFVGFLDVRDLTPFIVADERHAHGVSAMSIVAVVRSAISAVSGVVIVIRGDVRRATASWMSDMTTAVGVLWRP
jgi:CBS domain containing-hemolysin-like protein